MEGEIEAPLVSRGPWLWPILGASLTLNNVRFLEGSPLLTAVGLVVLWVVVAARFVGLRRWRVTFDGEAVTVATPFSAWRFRPEDVGSLVLPTFRPEATIVRARPVERIVLGLRLPWPFPWRRGLPTYVRPEWFTDVAGVAPGAIRRAGHRPPATAGPGAG